MSKSAGKKTGKEALITHEPTVPVNWPYGHVAVGLTGPEHLECIEVTIHGVTHYLHTTTAQALLQMLESKIFEWNMVSGTRRPVGYFPISEPT